jgi:DNA-binding transcriptional MerR regulator
LREFYSITELTREFDISTRTLRFYEDEGLIQPVRRGRTRLFRPADRHLVRQIIRGRRLGFSINEIREIIQMYREPPGEGGQLKLMIRRIQEKRELLRQKRRDLEETLTELDQAEEACVERLVELGVNT